MLGITPDLLGTAATLYGFGAAASALLQARQIVKRSCDVSARFFASYVGGYAIWLLYGASIGSMLLILVDLVGLLCGGLTLAITLALLGSLLHPSSWDSCPARQPVPIHLRRRSSHVSTTLDSERIPGPARV